MKNKELKVDETYNVQLHFREIDPDGKLWIREADEGNIIKLTLDGAYISTHHLLFSNDLISPLPKYDPCRRFKKGDIVEPREVHGRKDAELSGCSRYVVTQDETSGNLVVAKPKLGKGEVVTHAVYLELVTPVEELEPYSVLETDTTNGFDIIRDGLCVMTFPFGAKEAGYYRNKLAARDAAEAERDRLNAEWRKEQE